MTTQQAVTGVMGPEHVISYEEALTRHTAGAARLTCEEHLRGTLTPPGRLADLTVGSGAPPAPGERAPPAAGANATTLWWTLTSER